VKVAYVYPAKSHELRSGQRDAIRVGVGLVSGGHHIELPFLSLDCVLPAKS
jgi:hypothetical protein